MLYLLYYMTYEFLLNYVIISNSHFHSAAHKLLNDKSILPNYLTVNLVYDKEKECVENSEVIENPKTININYEESIRFVFFYLTYFLTNFCSRYIIL